MTINYESLPASNTTTHDHVYTTLLGVSAFFLIIGISTLFWLRQQPSMPIESKSGLLLPLTIETCYLIAIIPVLLLRIAAPNFRRWPTFGLNIVLLAFVPFGTALAIYGFMKVDKQIRQTEVPSGSDS